jgi:putative SOS response-associated peptidase YedK
MPVILHERDFNRWLDREETHQLPVDLLRPSRLMRWRHLRSVKMSAMSGTTLLIFWTERDNLRGALH